MTARSESSLAALLLTSRLIEGEIHPLTTGQFWNLVSRVPDPASLIGLDKAGVASTSGLDPVTAERILQLLDGATQLAFNLERMEEQGFWAITPFDDSYPRRLVDRLRDSAPPVLYGAGPKTLLSLDSLGIVGSRDVSPEGVEIARDAARVAVSAGLSVVSGGAKGVDQQSMTAAYQAGGTVVGYLAESLERRVKDPDTRRVIGEELVCLVTACKPSAGFSRASAMGRNKLIYAASFLTLVVASGLESGGTWEGATEALRRRYGQVAVWLGDGSGPGNEAIAGLGAVPVSSFEELKALVTGRHEEPPIDKGQLALGL
jgi:predicted Rossmann fold nucleotide-binding protein DprA/Smf involved in DNA uptake